MGWEMPSESGGFNEVETWFQTAFVAGLELVVEFECDIARFAQVVACQNVAADLVLIVAFVGQVAADQADGGVFRRPVLQVGVPQGVAALLNAARALGFALAFQTAGNLPFAAVYRQFVAGVETENVFGRVGAEIQTFGQRCGFGFFVFAGVKGIA